MFLSVANPNVAPPPRRRPKASALLLFVLVLITVAPAAADLSGGAHDFSALGWSGGEICRPCHTPHNALPVEAPLWNHTVSAATYTLYDSPTMSASAPQQPGPGSVSRLCLSCHDGTVALDSMDGATGSTMISGDALLGTNLSDDHPVGMQWTHQTAIPACSNCHNLHGPNSYPGPVQFFNGRVECASCHDVHDKENIPNLLVMSNTGSALCLHCHGK